LTEGRAEREALETVDAPVVVPRTQVYLMTRYALPRRPRDSP
jgi:hypothetical protein